MDTIYFASSNKDKVNIAKHACSSAGIKLEQAIIDIDEIQGEDPIPIITDKARRAYEILGKPLVVSDDTWDIPALNGFPGPYMKSINSWFSSDDFIRLMHGITNRKIILHQYLAFIDEDGVEIFTADLSGIVLNEAKGNDTKAPIKNVVAFDMDGGKSLTEVYNSPTELMNEQLSKRADAWPDLLNWYKQKYL